MKNTEKCISLLLNPAHTHCSELTTVKAPRLDLQYSRSCQIWTRHLISVESTTDCILPSSGAFTFPLTCRQKARILQRQIWEYLNVTNKESCNPWQNVMTRPRANQTHCTKTHHEEENSVEALAPCRVYKSCTLPTTNFPFTPIHLKYCKRF